MNDSYRQADRAINDGTKAIMPKGDQPKIDLALERLEKQLAELGEQWNRCADRISSIIEPIPPLSEKEVQESTNTVALAQRIDLLTIQARRICDSIRNNTNAIEL